MTKRQKKINVVVHCNCSTGGIIGVGNLSSEDENLTEAQVVEICKSLNPDNGMPRFRPGALIVDMDDDMVRFKKW